MKQSYFITGAQGFIGAWVVKALIERGDIPIAFDRSGDSRRLSAILAPALLGEVKFIYGDITDGQAVHTALGNSGAARIIHLAGLQVPTCKADPVAGAMVNIIGTLNLFEAARSLGIASIVYASSAAVYGQSEDDIPLTESFNCEPLSHYGVFKRANEGNARIYYLDHRLSTVGLRPLTVYGVGRDTGLTSDPTKAMKAAILGRPFHIRFGGATNMQYVADVAAAFIASADRAPAGAHVFNLHGETLPLETVVATINQYLPPDARNLITFGGPPIPVAAALSDHAIRQVIGDLPSTSFATGAQETLTRFAELRDQGRLDTSELEPQPVNSAVSR